MLTFLILLWIACVIFWLFYAIGLSQIIQRMRVFRIEMRAGSPDEIPEINMEHLNETTVALKALGFERVNDVVTRNYHDKSQITAPISDPSAEPVLQPARLQPHILSRITRHPQHGCLGIISSMVIADTRGKRPPKQTFWVAFHSFATQGNWDYSTTSYKPSIAQDKVTRVCCQPRVLWTRMPKATTLQLLDKHLARRAQIARVAHIEWAPRPTAEDYIEGDQQWVENARAVYGQLNAFGLWNRLRQAEKERKNPEWLGELKGQLGS